jgi:hypothetical protein
LQPGKHTMINTKNCPSVIFLLAAVLMGSAYWIVSWAVNPSVTLDQNILFRPGGDPDYLPQVSAIARLEFGETAVKELAGQGVRLLPFPSLFIHAVLVRLGGDTGFVIADILAFVLYGWMLSCFLKTAGIPRPIAELITLLVLSGALNWVVTNYFPGFPVRFWNTRLPRAFITETFVVAFLILASRFIYDHSACSMVRTWALMGALGACLIQSDIWQAMNMALLAMFLVVFLLLRDWKIVLRGLVVAVSVAAIICAPFVYQRLHESPDIMRRMGIFASGHQLILLEGGRLFLFALLILLLGVLLCYGLRCNATTSARSTALVIGVAIIASLLSGPLSLLILGHGLQVYHFRQEIELILGYAVLLCSGFVFQDILVRLDPPHPINALRIRKLTFAAAVILCLTLAALRSYAVIKDEMPAQGTMLMAGAPEQRYKSSFAELHAELLQSQYAHAQVLGTFDIQLADWWQYRNKNVYLPDLTNTTISDLDVEARVYSFLRMLEVTSADFNRLLDNNYFLLRVLSGQKYQANARYTPWPINEYSLDAQRRVAGTSILERLHLEVPLSERSRLLDGYIHFDALTQPYRKLDIIVLLKGDLRRFFHPEKGNLSFSWENDTFEIWVPRKVGITEQRGLPTVISSPTFRSWSTYSRALPQKHAGLGQPDAPAYGWQ